MSATISQVIPDSPRPAHSTCTTHSVSLSALIVTAQTPSAWNSPWFLRVVKRPITAAPPSPPAILSRINSSSARNEHTHAGRPVASRPIPICHTARSHMAVTSSTGPPTPAEHLQLTTLDYAVRPQEDVCGICARMNSDLAAPHRPRNPTIGIGADPSPTVTVHPSSEQLPPSGVRMIPCQNCPEGSASAMVLLSSSTARSPAR